MIDYIAESRLVATVQVSGNLQRTLGVALSYFHREQSRKIALIESTQKPAESRFQVAILKAEIAEFEDFVKEVELLTRQKRVEEKWKDEP